MEKPNSPGGTPYHDSKRKLNPYLTHPDEMKWVSVTEYPNYEICKDGRIRSRLTGAFVKTYGGADYENVKSVYLWTNEGRRECRSILALLRVAAQATDLYL